MYSDVNLTTATILAAFLDSVTEHGGQVTDRFDDGRRLFVRSVLPQSEILKAGDEVRGGVALRATDVEVWVHPFVFREVCRNGIIISRALETRHIEDLQFHEPDEALYRIREAVEACCARDAFANAARSLRRATETEVEVGLNLLPLLSQCSARVQADTLSHIMKEFFGGKDHSQFGLVNAITATARDTRDPQLRWDLEELGGGVLVDSPAPAPDGGTLSKALHHRAVSVG